jgi:hypothetical protein
VVPVTQADPTPPPDQPEIIAEAIEPAASQPAMPPQEPQQGTPFAANSDRQKESARLSSLKQTAVALKERLSGDLRVLLGCPLPRTSSGATPLMVILPNPQTKPLQVPL